VNNSIPVIYNPDLLVLVLKTARIARLIPSSTVVDISYKINCYWYFQRLKPVWHWKNLKEQRQERRSQQQRVAEGIDVASAAKLKKGGVLIKHSRAKKILHYLGLLPDPNLELKQQLAAMKIQQAWRWRKRATRASERRIMLGTSSSASKLFPNDNQTETQVGKAMAENTGQRIAKTILLSLLITYLFTYQERDATSASTMVILHGQTSNNNATNSTIRMSLAAARTNAIPKLFEYDAGLDEKLFFSVRDTDDLREREKLKIVVEGNGTRTHGKFTCRDERVAQSRVQLVATVFTLFVWFLGVIAFAGPIMTLVITPIERMIRLLGMLTLDPLGYQSNSRFKKFLFEEDAMVGKSQWTKEVLKGMETAFLMSTILQIGNLMQVGFGTAGVEIIRNNLQKGQKTNMLILNEGGSTVSCIFLFCDIRQFTDATECLQEEVFVFTNRIAAVVHSVCHAYGGAANKNVGDAFLVSWQLEDDGLDLLMAKHQQADKALLSVVKICMALQYDDYYVNTMTKNAREALLTKLEKRPGPVVQMGFGLHAGKAVQGAIGSQRKIDPTYVSEAVEKAEFLESSTKQYGLKMLMSDSFHKLLHTKIRRRCRKIDQVYFHDDADDDGYKLEIDEVLARRMELFTYDMDIAALSRKKIAPIAAAAASGLQGENKDMKMGASFKRAKSVRRGMKGSSSFDPSGRQTFSEELMREGSTIFGLDSEEVVTAELVLPTGVVHYKERIWLQGDIRLIREQFTTAVIQDFDTALQKYYDRDWVSARRYFEMVLKCIDDGPSKYFLEEMKTHGWKPPKHFDPIRKAD
jgi:class 3 adenylate cyclase